jgi:CelD/BcsL family acetyltransferase involved in cellulose biosynthesis
VDLAVHADLGEVCEIWRSFEQQADHTVFQAYNWLATWHRHVGVLRQIVPVIALGREQSGEILFILPLAIEPTGAVRRLTWLGWQVCDYNGPLLASRFATSIGPADFVRTWRHLIKLLEADPRFRFDLIDLDKMAERVGRQRNPFLNLEVRAHPSSAHVTLLGDDWHTFYAAKRSPATRKRERRQLRQLADHGKIRFIEVNDCDERIRTLRTLVEQKSRAFAKMGIEDPFLQPGHRDFFLAIANDCAMQGHIHISRLDVGDQVVAASMGLILDDCYYLILSSYHGGELSRFGPGRELLQHAIAQRFRRFDFTVGDEAYKRDWSDVELPLHDYLTAVTLRGWVAKAATAEFRRVKRFIKRSPGLWRVFKKARALAGSLSSP